MKKIGMITLHSWFNYGSMLDALALNSVLDTFSDHYECEIIDFVPPSIADNVRSYRLYTDDPCYAELREKYKEEIIQRKKVFGEFRKLYKQGSHTYLSDEEIEANPPQYDIYVSGSDQIWNANFRIASRAYFLAFTKSEEKYAFSTSIGRCKKDKLSAYLKYITQYKKIYIREAVGAQYLIDEMSVEADTMIDPTLILNKNYWLSLIPETPMVSGDYILVYSTLDDELEIMMPVVKYLKEKLGMKVVLFGMVIPRTEEWIENIVVAGPLEFIRLFRDAKLVVANSFHATAFSVNLNVPFVIYNDDLENPRKEGLLKMVGLMGRVVHSLEECKKIDDLLEVDFSYANLVLERERERAMNNIRSCFDD